MSRVDDTPDMESKEKHQNNTFWSDVDHILNQKILYKKSQNIEINHTLTRDADRKKKEISMEMESFFSRRAVSQTDGKWKAVREHAEP